MSNSFSGLCPVHWSKIPFLFILFIIFSCAGTRIDAGISAERSTIKQVTEDYQLPGVTYTYGFNAGIMAALLLKNPERHNVAAASSKPSHFRLTGGAEFIQKGYRQNFDDLNYNWVRINYLKIPVMAFFSYPLLHGNVIAGFGPYFSYAVGGKGVNVFNGETYSTRPFYGGRSRFDYGLSFQAGYEFSNGLSASLGYDLGLLDIEAANEVRIYNRTHCFYLRYDLAALIKKKK